MRAKGVPYCGLAVMVCDQAETYDGCDPHPGRSRSWAQLNHQTMKISDAG